MSVANDCFERVFDNSVRFDRVPVRKSRRPLVRFIGMVLAVGQVLIAAAAWAAPATISSRVLFDEDFTWLTKSGAERLLRRAQAAGFDTIIPCIWHGQGTTWESANGPKDPRFERVRKSNPDPLMYLITQAHMAGIKVFPWFTVALRQREFFSEFAKKGTPDQTFDWHDVAFRKWMQSVVLEVVHSYDIDGLNLDYVRTRGICVSTSCVEDYKNAKKRDLIRDVAVMALDKSARDAITDWNSAAVGDFIQHVSDSVRRSKPDIAITIDSLAGDEAWIVQGANGLAWLANGWIDRLFHMDYADPLNVWFLNRLHNRVAQREKITVLVGNYKMSSGMTPKPIARTASELVRLIGQGQQLWPESPVVAVYEYRFLTDEQTAALRSTIKP